MIRGASIRNLIRSGAVLSVLVTGSVVFAEDDVWVPMAGEIKTAWHHPHAIDASTNRLFIHVAGDQGTGMSTGVWVIDLDDPLPRWNRISGAVAPGIVTLSIHFDRPRNQLVAFGPTLAGTEMGVSAMALAYTPTWSVLSHAGLGPPYRESPGATLDPANGKVVMFGGSRPWPNFAWLSEVWEFSLESREWSPSSLPGGPTPRTDAAVFHDPVSPITLVYGGWGPVNTSYPDHLYDLWKRNTAGTPGWSLLSISSGLASPPMATDVLSDPASGRFFGIADGVIWFQESYRWGVWRYFASLPGSLAAHSPRLLGVDRDSRLLVGGRWSYNDLWALATDGSGQWTEILEHRDKITSRFNPQLVMDPANRRAILFGGTIVSGNATSDLWTLGLDESQAEWTHESYVGGNPGTGAPAIWDPVRARIVTFSFGRKTSAISPGGAWTRTELPYGGTSPSDRTFAGSAYDPLRDRMLMFAGYPAVNARNQLWSLSFASGTPQWLLHSPAGVVPSQRWGHSLLYDSSRDRMLMFGGGDGVFTNDLFALAIGGATPTWSRITVPGVQPLGRAYHAAAYDPVGDRLLIVGGRNGTQYLNDVWELRFGQPLEWRRIEHAANLAPRETNGVYDAATRRFIVFGGNDATTVYRDTWALLVVATADVPVSGRGVSIALDGAQPNPARRDLRIAFSLPDGQPARLDLIDLTGRRVRTLEVGSLGAGRHQVDIASGTLLAPGLYFARLSRAGETLTAKVCIAR